MKNFIEIVKKIVLMMITMSILISSIATPSSYAKLDLQEGEFYYSGTTEGAYVPKDNIFKWLVNCLQEITDWFLGMMTLGFRMVFIGWTALIEKALTWTLESTLGVSADGSIVEDSIILPGMDKPALGLKNVSDYTGFSDSSNNITVESIVYNKVAMFDINFFKLEYDKTLSGTGQKMACDTCRRYVDECHPDAEDAGEGSTCANYIDPDSGEEVACDCNGCAACTKYLQQIQIEDPIIIKLKKLVATWYTIIRLLSVAAMLITLIVVGMKMALSTIASDKAVYKRMLVDWIVGFIIVFSIHYFMLLVINMNGVVVNLIAESASDFNKSRMMRISSEEFEYTNQELELKIYEEVRTRAYDAKLSNGLIGMVMYMTLVFMAVKYTVIYLKRFLTLAVLTLMGPAIGVAYGIQKVLTGKSQAFKTWMNEYVMNVIIQIVHALIYAVFISQALLISLQSISGMILALIFMNYTAKADELFKKIFKFGGGDSLLGHTENAMEQTSQAIQSTYKLAVGAKPMAKVLTNTPYAMGVKAAGAYMLAKGVQYVRNKRNIGMNDEIFAEPERIANEEVPETVRKEGESDAAFNARKKDDDEKREKVRRRVVDEGIGARERTVKQRHIEKDMGLSEKDKALLGEDAEALKTKVAILEKQADIEKKNGGLTLETETKLKEAQGDYDRLKELNTTASDKALFDAHIDRLLSFEDILTTTEKKSFAELAFGTYRWNSKTLRFETENDAIYNQFSLDKILGLTEKDQQEIKGFAKDIGGALLGIGSMFVGMGTIVTNPKAGLALMATGVGKYNKVFGRNEKLTTRGGKYTFGRFAGESLATIRNKAIQRAQKEHDAINIADITRRHPKLVSNIKDGTLNVGTTIAVGGTGFAKYIGEKFIANSKIDGRFIASSQRRAKQLKKQIQKFQTEADAVEKIGYISNMDAKILLEKESVRDEAFIEMCEEAGLEYRRNNETGEYEVVGEKQENLQQVEPKEITENDFKTKKQAERWNIVSTETTDDGKPVNNLEFKEESPTSEDVNTALRDIILLKNEGFEIKTEIDGIEIDTRDYTTAEEIIEAYIEQKTEILVQIKLAEMVARREAEIEARREAEEEKAREEEREFDPDADIDMSDYDENEPEEDEIIRAIRKDLEKDIREMELIAELNVAKSSGVREDKIDVREINTTVGKNEITTTDIDIINETLDEVIMDISAGEEIDLESAKTQDEIIKLLSSKLKAKNILAGKQTAEILFKQGRAGLMKETKKKVFERNCVVRNAKRELEDVLPDEEVKVIQDIISEMTREKHEDRTKVMMFTGSEIIKRMENGTAGSRVINPTDGSSRVRRIGEKTIEPVQLAPEIKKEERIAAIEQYIKATTTHRPTAEQKTEEFRRKSNIKADRTFDDKSQSKVRDALSMMLFLEDEPETVEEKTRKNNANGSDEVVNQIKAERKARYEAKVAEAAEQSATLEEFDKKFSTDMIVQELFEKMDGPVILENGLGRTVELDERQARLTRLLYSDVKGLQNINEGYLARETSEIKKGSRTYWEHTGRRSEYASEYASAEIERIQAEANIQNATEADRRDPLKKEALDNALTAAVIKSRTNAKLAQIERTRMNTRGPIVDVKSYLNNDLFSSITSSTATTNKTNTPKRKKVK